MESDLYCCIYKEHIFTFERDGDGHMAVPFLRHLPRAPGKFKCFESVEFMIKSKIIIDLDLRKE